LLDVIKKAREETCAAAQTYSAAPTGLITDEGEGPSSYRLRGALPHRVDEEEEEVWVQKRSVAMPQGGIGG